MIKKIRRIIRKGWSFFLVQILNLERKVTKDFNGIKLTVNTLEIGGTGYFNPSSYKESVNPLFSVIQAEMCPTHVLDIGANYGFTSNVFATRFPQAEVFAIEPSKKLCKYIEINKKINDNDNITVVRAVCDQTGNVIRDFSINPIYSQDNRVSGESFLWKKEKVISTSIDDILLDRDDVKAVFIKIDTQGFEEFVFKGGEKFLSQNTNWLIKTEFSPYLLSDQGSDPKQFLQHLIEKYDVVDFHNQTQFKEDKIDNMFHNKLAHEDVEDFLEFVVKLDHEGIGWTELLIRNKLNNA